MPQFESHFFSSLIFWEVISFAILFAVLYKFAFPPILEMLETREHKIRESLEQAERLSAISGKQVQPAGNQLERKIRGAIIVPL